MSDRSRRRYALGSVLALLGGAVLVRLIACGPSACTGGADGAGDGTGGADLGAWSAPVTIDGHAIEPISPGVMVPLDLEFVNPHDVDMSVTDLSVTVQGVSAPRADANHPCAVDDFAVDQVSISLKITLAASGTGTLHSLDVSRAAWPRVGMLKRSVNQDGCKGALLTIAYTASATSVI